MLTLTVIYETTPTSIYLLFSVLHIKKTEHKYYWGKAIQILDNKSLNHLLFKVKDRYSVAYRTQNTVTILIENNITLPIDGA